MKPELAEVNPLDMATVLLACPSGTNDKKEDTIKVKVSCGTEQVGELLFSAKDLKLQKHRLGLGAKAILEALGEHIGNKVVLKVMQCFTKQDMEFGSFTVGEKRIRFTTEETEKLLSTVKSKSKRKK